MSEQTATLSPYQQSKPPPPSLAARYWPGPGAGPGPRPLVAALIVGVLAGAIVVGSPIGAGLSAVALAVALVVVIMARRGGVTTGQVVLACLTVGLIMVPTLTDSDWLVVLCLLGAFGLGALAVVNGRTWSAVLLAVPSLWIAGLRSLPWARRSLQGVPAPRETASWLRGLGLAALLTVIVGALLASADADFAWLMGNLVPNLDLGMVPARVIVGVAVAGLVLACCFAVVAPPRWEAFTVQARRRPAREWLPPLVAVDVLLAAFLVIQAGSLFGGRRIVLEQEGLTVAERAREGFGQLFVVTVLVVALLAWAGRRCDRSAGQGRLLGWLGGGLVVLALLLVVSALRRLWLYQEAFGYTVLRVVAGVFEVWLALVLVMVALAWWPRIARALPRLIVGSAGVVLLGLGVASPDAIVARADVTRFERTGDIDVNYLSTLSADAVPALSRLAEPVRSCVLADKDVDGWRVDWPQGWPGANLARARAVHMLDERPVLKVNCDKPLEELP